MKITRRQMIDKSIKVRRASDRVAAIDMGKRNASHEDKKHKGTRGSKNRKALKESY